MNEELPWATDDPIEQEIATAIEGVKADAGKARYSLIPVQPLHEVAQVMTFGAMKYADNNWQKVDNAVVRYTDAALRHIESWRGGEQNDHESGNHHLAHAICCLLFIMWFELGE